MSQYPITSESSEFREASAIDRGNETRPSLYELLLLLLLPRQLQLLRQRHRQARHGRHVVPDHLGLRRRRRRGVLAVVGVDLRVAVDVVVVVALVAHDLGGGVIDRRLVGLDGPRVPPDAAQK